MLQYRFISLLSVSFEISFIQIFFVLLSSDFTFTWERINLMETLQILAIGEQKVFGPSLRNLPARLSIMVALFVLNSLNDFKINTQ